MNKFLIVISVSVLLVICASFIVLHFSQPKGAIKQGELSDRTQQFLSDQAAREQKSSIIDTQEREPQKLEVLIPECFFLNVDVQVSLIKTGNDQTECVVLADIVEPRGRVMVATELSTTPIDDLSGVMLRESKTDEYEPWTDESLEYPHRQYKTSSGMETFAIKDNQLITVMFTNSIGNGDQLQVLTREIVEQVELTGNRE